MKRRRPTLAHAKEIAAAKLAQQQVSKARMSNTHDGRVLWGVRRYDVGEEPVNYVMEGNEKTAEQHARSMVADMTATAEQNGWDNAPELLRCRVVWEVVGL